MLKSRQPSDGVCADMEIVCPPGIPKKLCLERARQLRRLTTMQLPSPPRDQPVPPTPEVPVWTPTVETPVANPTPPSIDVDSLAKWSKGDDIRTISHPYVLGPGDDYGDMLTDVGVTTVSDLMGGYGPAY